MEQPLDTLMHCISTADEGRKGREEEEKTSRCPHTGSGEEEKERTGNVHPSQSQMIQLCATTTSIIIKGI
jgi:hypothetical protein